MSNGDLASLIGLVGALVLVCVAASAVLMPFAVFSIASSLRGIHRELQQLNGAGAGRVARATVPAEQIGDAATVPTLSHRLTR